MNRRGFFGFVFGVAAVCSEWFAGFRDSTGRYEPQDEAFENHSECGTVYDYDVSDDGTVFCDV